MVVLVLFIICCLFGLRVEAITQLPSKERVQNFVNQNFFPSPHENKKVYDPYQQSGQTYSILQRTQFSGDFRVRYQYLKLKKIGVESSHSSQFRGRLRLNFKTDAIPDFLTARYGVATGSSNPYDGRSNNINFEDGMSFKEIVITHANIQIHLTDQIDILVGKYYNPYYQVDKQVFDPDLAFEGVNVSWRPPIIFKTLLQAGVIWIDNDVEFNEGDNKDVRAYILSSQISNRVIPQGKLTVGLNYYDFVNIKGAQIASIEKGNSGGLPNPYWYRTNDYNVLHFMLKYVYSVSSHLVLTPHFEYLKNLGAKKYNSGYTVGVKFGVKELEEMGAWAVRLKYGSYDGDVMPDFLSNSDIFKGNIGCQGWVLGWEVIIFPEVKANLTYAGFDRKNALSGEYEEVNMFCADLIFKF